MKIKVILTSIFTILLLNHLTAQIQEYLKENTIDLTANKIVFDTNFYENQVFMFGFVHGSETPQKIDFRLLRHLNKNGIKYYAPEVDFSLAFFLNQYLVSGSEDLLDYITFCYSSVVSQDASIQFMDKWRKIFKMNQSLDVKNKIQVLGFDRMTDESLSLTHLAFLAPTKKTGIPEIDSLKFYTNTSYNEIHIKSGKPIWKSGKSFAYFFGGKKADLFQVLKRKYEADVESFLDCFGNNAEEVQLLMENTRKGNREKIIFENFKKIAVPIIENGGKIYCNYGYFHIQQETINGEKSFAAMVKSENKFSIVSIQGLLVDSECLEGLRLCPDKIIDVKGVKFKKMNYCGYKTSTSLDGHTPSERVNGIEFLEDILVDKDIILTSLVSADTPFKNQMMFADYRKGDKYWQVDNNSVATDYFQYIITMKNSKANIPRLENHSSTH